MSVEQEIQWRRATATTPEQIVSQERTSPVVTSVAVVDTCRSRACVEVAVFTSATVAILIIIIIITSHAKNNSGTESARRTHALTGGGGGGACYAQACRATRDDGTRTSRFA